MVEQIEFIVEAMAFGGARVQPVGLFEGLKFGIGNANAEEPGIKGVDVWLKTGEAVPLRIYGNEDDLEVRGQVWRFPVQGFLGCGQFHHGQRTDIGAESVAEKEKDRVACQVGEVEGRAVKILPANWRRRPGLLEYGARELMSTACSAEERQ